MSTRPWKVSEHCWCCWAIGCARLCERFAQGASVLGLALQWFCTVKVTGGQHASPSGMGGQLVAQLARGVFGLGIFLFWVFPFLDREVCIFHLVLQTIFRGGNASSLSFLHKKHAAWYYWNVSVDLGMSLAKWLRFQTHTHRCISKLGVVVPTCDPGTWEVQAWGSGVEGHLLLPTKFKASLGYMRSYLNKANQKTITDLFKEK